ncbi:gdsl esterase/lipase [Quercus suber]|uniref:Gdsl esterase/lipase n=1 Tax=Quercus suber TaxID=58331 RepID=A0AAW0JYR9_QUESU
MANSKYLFLQISCFILLLSLSPSYTHNKSHKSTTPPTGFQARVDFKGCFNKVYAFGDSNTDTGNAYYLGALKSFISDLFSQAWSPYSSLESSNLSGYRLSNGRLVIDFLCEALHIPHLSAYKDSSANFSTLLGKENAREKMRLHANQSLGKLSFGLALLDKGAKFLVVQGLPTIGCLPLQLTTCPSNDRDQNGCSVSANLVIKGHNDLLQKRLDEIRMHYKDSMILYIDYYSAFKTILEKHRQYQFKEPFKACCGSGRGPFNYLSNLLCGDFGTSTCKDSRTHINFDGVHLTKNMHLQLFDLFYNQGFCTPSFSGLIKKKKGKF